MTATTMTLEEANAIAQRRIEELEASLKKAVDERDNFVRANTELGLELQRLLEEVRTAIIDFGENCNPKEIFEDLAVAAGLISNGSTEDKGVAAPPRSGGAGPLTKRVEGE